MHTCSEVQFLIKICSKSLKQYFLCPIPTTKIFAWPIIINVKVGACEIPVFHRPKVINVQFCVIDNNAQISDARLQVLRQVERAAETVGTEMC